MSNLLASLKSMTTVVADTGDITAIQKYTPEDATTNPSLLLKAASLPQYAPLISDALSFASKHGTCRDSQITEASDRLAVLIGKEIASVVPGRVSTEVDARLSFDTHATVAKARKLIAMYDELGVNKSRILIKIASTWEGIKAAEILEKEGINCNLTLLFNFAQAQACAQAGIYLISPFVGRILDWFKANTEQSNFEGDNDPGVKSVAKIYHYYKTMGYSTIVMGASFRNINEIISLAGCDRLTISPSLLAELENTPGELTQVLNDNGTTGEHDTPLSESTFRWEMNQDPMATEKLAEGIRNFAIDQAKLESILADRIDG